MPHFRKKYADRINTKYQIEAEIWYRIAWNQMPHLIPHGSRHMDGAILLAIRWSRWRNLIEIVNRNTRNIKTAVENANSCGKNKRYAHFAEMCEKYGNMRNTRQSHIRIKLTCLTMRPDIKRQTDRHTQRERERERWETGSIPGFHGVGVPAVVGLLGRWHQSVILPRLRDHCDNSLANTHTHVVHTYGIWQTIRFFDTRFDWQFHSEPDRYKSGIGFYPASCLMTCVLYSHSSLFWTQNI